MALPLPKAAPTEAARDLLAPRVAVRPVEYPELLEYRDAIRHSYWLHTEFNLSDDVQDFHTRVDPVERQAIVRTTLVIAQVEVSVKSFWGDLMKRLPKPEVGAVGYTFAESEVRHQDAYAHLLHVLGLDETFAAVHEAPALRGRIELLRSINEDLPAPHERVARGRDLAFAILTFSALVEHVSLFGQFLTMKAFLRHTGRFKGVSNVVDATSQEEQIHGLFGYELVRTLHREHPEWFDRAFEDDLRAAVRRSYAAERDLLDWIFEAGELDFLPLADVRAFLEGRYDHALEAVGYRPEFRPPADALARVAWFDEETLAGKHVDFFHKRPTAYAKKARAFSAGELF